MQSDKEIEKAKMFNTKIERTCNHRYRSNFRFVRKYSMQLFIRLKECVAKNSWVYLSLSPLPFASLLFSSICKASSDNHLAFLHIFSLGMVLLSPVFDWRGKPTFHKHLKRSLPSEIMIGSRIELDFLTDFQAIPRCCCHFSKIQ